MAEHSKTPWRLGTNGGDDTVFAGNRVVAMCDTDVNAPHVDKANAAFIVRAVNCHAELVEALGALCEKCAETLPVEASIGYAAIRKSRCN